MNQTLQATFLVLATASVAAGNGTMHMRITAEQNSSFILRFTKYALYLAIPANKSSSFGVRPEFETDNDTLTMTLKFSYDGETHVHQIHYQLIPGVVEETYTFHNKVTLTIKAAYECDPGYKGVSCAEKDPETATTTSTTPAPVKDSFHFSTKILIVFILLVCFFIMAFCFFLGTIIRFFRVVITFLHPVRNHAPPPPAFEEIENFLDTML